MDDPRQWLEQHAITEVECLVPDIQRHSPRQGSCRSPKLLASLEGAPDLPADERLHRRRHRPLHRRGRRWRYQDPDTLLEPDMATLCLAPGAGSSTGLCVRRRPSSRRQAVGGVAAPCAEEPCIDLYRQRGWRAVVAPEMEFYLTAPNPNPDRRADGAGRPLGPRRDRRSIPMGWRRSTNTAR